MSGAAVRFAGVGVRYPGTETASVDDVTLAVDPGELAVLIGPSGSGKSTLLRTVNRLVEPTAGSVYVDERDVRDGDAIALRRSIGYVIQAVGLFPHLTIAANVGVVPRLLGWDAQRIAARVDELLALVRLDPGRFRDRYPRELSGGEQQRVGVARALAGEPRVLLMDEPFGAVDAIVRAALQDELRALHRRLGTTIIVVTHDVDEALRLADRLVVLREGRLVQVGTPEEVLAQPAEAFVRDLLGIDEEGRRLAAARPTVARAS